MLFRFLDKMREKPRAARSRFAFFVAFSLTLVLAGFWALSIPTKFTTIGEVNEASVGGSQLGDLRESAESGIQGLVDSAELFQGFNLEDDGGEQQGGVPSAFDEGTLFDSDFSQTETAEGATSSEVESKPQNTAARRVLIATSSSEIEE